MESDAFVKTLVYDYVDNGYGEKIDDSTIRSLTNDNELSFEPLADDEGKTVGVNVFTNGVMTVSAKYTDKDFVETVNLSVLSDLGVL